MSKESQKNTLLMVTHSTSTARLVGKHLHDFFNIMTAKDAESAWDALLEIADAVLELGLEPVSRDLRPQLDCRAE